VALRHADEILQASSTDHVAAAWPYSILISKDFMKGCISAAGVGMLSRMLCAKTDTNAMKLDAQARLA